MAPETRNASRQRDLSEGVPSSNPAIWAKRLSTPTTTTEEQAMEETLRVRIQQHEVILVDALALNMPPPQSGVCQDLKISSYQMFSLDKVDKHPLEVKQVFLDIQPTTSQATTSLKMLSAIVQASSQLTNTPLVHNMSSYVLGTIHETPLVDTYVPTWTPSYP